jgi:membrane protein YdbS with pleckstrin-like domain
VSEVSLRRGLVQRRYGLGTLHLDTAAGGGGAGRSGISLRDVPEAEQLFEHVQGLIGTSPARLTRR